MIIKMVYRDIGPKLTLIKNSHSQFINNFSLMATMSYWPLKKKLRIFQYEAN